MSRASAAVQDAGLGERECATTDAEYPRPARLRCTDDVEEPLIDGLDRVRRNGDEVGIGRHAEVVVDHHVEAEAGAHCSWRRGGDGEVEPWAAAVGAVDPEDFAHDAELEWRDPGQRQQHDFLEHESSPSGRKLFMVLILPDAST